MKNWNGIACHGGAAATFTFESNTSDAMRQRNAARPPTDIFAARIGSTLHSGRCVIYSASSHSAMPKMLWVGIAYVQHLRHLSLPGFAQVLKAISGISRSYHTGRDVMILSSTGRHCVIVCTLSMSLGCDRVYP